MICYEKKEALRKAAIDCINRSTKADTYPEERELMETAARLLNSAADALKV